MTRKNNHSILAGVTGLMLATVGLAVAGDIHAPAQFVVGNKVAVPAAKMMPIGFMNFCEPFGALKTHQNTVFDYAGNEPAMSRAFGLVKDVQGGGKQVELDGFLMNQTGNFYDGCWARIYRIVDKQGKPVPLDTEESYHGFYLNLDTADHVVFVGRRQLLAKDGYVIDATQKPKRKYYHFADGIEIKKWDGIFIEKEADVIPADGEEEEGEDGEITRWHVADRADKDTVHFGPVAHTGQLPPGVDFGKSCLRTVIPAGEHGVNQVLFAGTDQSWYGQLYPGQKYRLEVWLKQSGLANGGKVKFSLSRQANLYGGVKTEFAVTGEWKKYTFDFTGPALPTDRVQPDGPSFTATGPGTFWLDNARIFAWYEPADLEKPFVPVRQLVTEMKNSQPETGIKGYIRSWAAMPQRSMDSILSYHSTPSKGFGKQETIPVHLGYCEASGMNPWITVNLYYSEEDWLALLEYLAAPYDPAKDSPKTKPWAYRRTQHRGNNTPWTDTFDKILFEFGNENWHNRANAEWIGFGRAGKVHDEGFQYGLFGKYMFTTIMEKSPWWKSQNLDKKVIFNLGGGYYAKLDNDGSPAGYGPDAMRGAANTSKMSSMALYVGPKWELNEKAEGKLTEDVFQKTLLAYQMGMREKVLDTDAARLKMKTMGYDYDLVSYEGGPGGYGGGSGKKKPSAEEKAAGIALGHSLAMGLTALDCWLDAYRHGFVAHELYTSCQGEGWSNHTMAGNGFRPTPAWQTMVLRNRELPGDMLEVADKSVPILTRPVLDKKGKPVIKNKKTKQPEIGNYPMARCYAFRQGDKYSVALISLKAPGQHDGQNFGDGSTPCSVALPFKSATKITLVTLQGDPSDTNDKSLKVAPQRRPVPAAALANGTLTVNRASGSTVEGLPTGSVYIYQFEGVQP